MVSPCFAGFSTIKNNPEIKLETTDWVANPITTAKIPPATIIPDKSIPWLEVNPKNEIIKIPKEKYAVIVFSGLVRHSSYSEKAQLLNDFIMANNLTQLEAIKIARYNPPWTLPFFRRNELMVKIM